VTRARQYSIGLLPIAQWKLAEVLLRTKGLASLTAIHEALAEAARLSRETGFKEADPFLCVARAELAALSGDQITRERELREAHRLFTEIGAPIRAAEVAKELPE